MALDPYQQSIEDQVARFKAMKSPQELIGHYNSLYGGKDYSAYEKAGLISKVGKGASERQRALRELKAIQSDPSKMQLAVDKLGLSSPDFQNQVIAQYRKDKASAHSEGLARAGGSKIGVAGYDDLGNKMEKETAANSGAFVDPNYQLQSYTPNAQGGNIPVDNVTEPPNGNLQPTEDEVVNEPIGTQLNIQRNLTPGMNGEDVKALQNFLINQGQSISSATGYYGSETKAAVEAWQRANGILPTNPSDYGFFGPKSRSFTSTGGVVKDQEQANKLLGQDYQVDTSAGTASLEPQLTKAETDYSNYLKTKSYGDYVESFSEQLGLEDLKKQISTASKAILDVNTKKIEETSDINDNPWISETQRIRKLQGLEAKYESKLTNAELELSRIQKLYDDGKQEAQFAAQLALDQQNKDREFEFQARKAAMELAGDNKLETEVVDEQGRKFLINSQTGEVIKAYDEFYDPSLERGKGSTNVTVNTGGGLGGTSTMPEYTEAELNRFLTKTELKDYSVPTGSRFRDVVGMIPDEGASQKQKEEAVSSYNQINVALGNKDLPKAFGASGLLTLPFTPAQALKKQVKQVKSLVDLNARQKLKGQGTITDKEMLILEQAATALDKYSSDEATLRELRKIRGVFAMAGGLKASVIINGKKGALSRADYEDAIRQGYKVTFN